jgi:hypothetical protein
MAVSTKETSVECNIADEPSIDSSDAGHRAIGHREHARLAIAAVRVSTEHMMSANIEHVRKATSEESAYKSYASGMIDMLSIARTALGFWDAEQIRQELERQNEAWESDSNAGPDAVAEKKAAHRAKKDPMYS